MNQAIFLSIAQHVAYGIFTGKWFGRRSYTPLMMCMPILGVEEKNTRGTWQGARVFWR